VNIVFIYLYIDRYCVGQLCLHSKRKCLYDDVISLYLTRGVSYVCLSLAG